MNENTRDESLAKDEWQPLDKSGDPFKVHQRIIRQIKTDDVRKERKTCSKRKVGRGFRTFLLLLLSFIVGESSRTFHCSLLKKIG